MLTKIAEDGRAYQASKVPHIQEYRRLTKKLPNLDEIKTYIAENLNGVERFRVATKFGGEWEDTPLKTIWEAMDYDETNAGMLLGRIVQDVLINEDTAWLCTKTKRSTKVEYAIAFYWRAA